MKIVKGNFGECRFCDNMDPEYGLPSLKDKSWDLCLTDPPYNLNFKGSSTKTKREMIQRNKLKTWYKDDLPRDKYFDLCWRWSHQCIQKSNIVIITPGYRNFKEWIQHYPDVEMGVFTDLSAQGGCKIASFRKWEPFLVFNIGVRKQHHRLKFAWIDIIMNCNQKNYGEYRHPCPKSDKLWSRFIKELKPISVLDPFLGSGTTAEVCEGLGIPWLGYELNIDIDGNPADYDKDIEKRIQRGIEKYKHQDKSKQVKLF